MRTLSSFMAGKKNTRNLEDAFLWLADIRRDSSNVSRYVRDRRNYTCLDESYTKKAMTIEPPEADMEGSLHDFKIGLDNTDKVEGAYLENGKYLDQEVVLRIMNVGSLETEADQIVFRGTVLRASLTNKAVVLECGSYDIRNQNIPNDKLYCRRCRAGFKTDLCGYSGGESSCDHLLETCDTTMSNRARFNGAPNMPIRRP